jgi:aspartyl-tRNA(Asn)/glutamyl-tRNA(Gln) amidotransferase subunit A
LISLRKRTSRELVESCLAAIKDPSGEGSRVFLEVHESEARVAADNADKNGAAGPLSGIPISIKDLFDEAGVVTRGGSTILANG